MTPTPPANTPPTAASRLVLGKCFASETISYATPGCCEWCGRAIAFGEFFYHARRASNRTNKTIGREFNICRAHGDKALSRGRAVLAAYE